MTTIQDLPKGWATASLGEVATYQNGRAFKPSEWGVTGIPIIRIQNLNDASADFNFSNRPHEEKFRVRNGELLYAWSASLGAYIWKGEDAWLNQHIFRVDHTKVIDRLFFYYALTNITAMLYDKAHGSGMVHVTKGRFEETPLRLPPLSEQHRIVAKLEELLSELDKGIEAFKTAREQLTVYHQAVLKHAFEGKLTEEWRKKHADELEPAEILLEKIKAEREQRYCQQLKDWNRAVKAWEAGGKEGKKPTKPGKPKELPSLTQEELSELPELPEGWGWIRLGTVIDEPKYGTSKKCSYESSGIGVLRIPNIVGGSINAEDLKYSVFDDDEKVLYSLEEGDLLVIRSNGSVSIVGQTALVKGSDTEYLYAGYLIRIRSNKNVLDSKYLNFLFTAHMFRSQIENKAKSTSGVNNINSGELQSLINPVCSVIEPDFPQDGR